MSPWTSLWAFLLTLSLPTGHGVPTAADLDSLPLEHREAPVCPHLRILPKPWSMYAETSDPSEREDDTSAPGDDHHLRPREPRPAGDLSGPSDVPAVFMLPDPDIMYGTPLERSTDLASWLHRQLYSNSAYNPNLGAPESLAGRPDKIDGDDDLAASSSRRYLKATVSSGPKPYFETMLGTERRRVEMISYYVPWPTSHPKTWALPPHALDGSTFIFILGVKGFWYARLREASHFNPDNPSGEEPDPWMQVAPFTKWTIISDECDISDPDVAEGSERPAKRPRPSKPVKWAVLATRSTEDFSKMVCDHMVAKSHHTQNFISLPMVRKLYGDPFDCKYLGYTTEIVIFTPDATTTTHETHAPNYGNLISTLARRFFGGGMGSEGAMPRSYTTVSTYRRRIFRKPEDPTIRRNVYGSVLLQYSPNMGDGRPRARVWTDYFPPVYWRAQSMGWKAISNSPIARTPRDKYGLVLDMENPVRQPWDHEPPLQ